MLLHAALYQGDPVPATHRGSLPSGFSLGWVMGSPAGDRGREDIGVWGWFLSSLSAVTTSWLLLLTRAPGSVEWPFLL